MWVSFEAAASQTAEDIPRPFEDTGELGGEVTALAADDNHLYFGIGTRLVILEANTRTGVPGRGIAGVLLPGTIKSAAVLSQGVVAVVAGDVVYFVEASPSAGAAIVGTYEPFLPIRAIEARNGICFLLGQQRVLVLDPSEPAAAIVLATIDLPAAAERNTQVIAGDEVLFVGAVMGSVLVYDVSLPEAPKLIGGAEGILQATRMAVSGRTLFVMHRATMFDDQGNRLAGLTIFALTATVENRVVKHGFIALIPPAPIPVPDEFRGVDIAAAGDHVFISGHKVGRPGATNTRQLRCWDVSDLSMPIELSRVHIEGLGDTVMMLISRGRVYLASNDAKLAPGGFQSPSIGVVDIASPSALSWLGYWQHDELGVVKLVSASNRHVIVAEQSGNIHIYEGPFQMGNRPRGYLRESMSMIVREMVPVGNRLYAFGGDLAVFDLSDRTHPVIRAQTPVTTALSAMAVQEPYVFATLGSPFDLPGGEPGYRLVVWQLTEGNQPTITQLGESPAASAIVRSIDVSGNYAYVVARDGGRDSDRLALFDVSQPAQPRFVMNVGLGDGVKPKSVYVRGERAFVTVRSEAVGEEGALSGLDIVDVSDPLRSRVLGSIRATASPEDDGATQEQDYELAAVDSYVLYACEEAVVHVVDVSDARRPVEVQRIHMPSVVTDIDAAGRHVYIVANNGALRTMRATYHPEDPRIGPPAYLPLAFAGRARNDEDTDVASTATRLDGAGLSLFVRGLLSYARSTP